MKKMSLEKQRTEVPHAGGADLDEVKELIKTWSSQRKY